MAEDGGQVLVVDHKSAARTDKDKAKRPDLQMALCSIAANELHGVDQVDLRYQNVIKTRTAKVEMQDIQRVDHDEAEAIEAVASGLELVHVAVSHPAGKRVMGRRRSWRCKECGYRRLCVEERSLARGSHGAGPRLDLALEVGYPPPYPDSPRRTTT